MCKNFFLLQMRQENEIYTYIVHLMVGTLAVADSWQLAHGSAINEMHKVVCSMFSVFNAFTMPIQQNNKKKKKRDNLNHFSNCKNRN